MRHALRTFGHATLVLLEDGIPLIATDPWLLGSVYWRSWWLERDPTPEEIDLVRRARYVYITHSHPDHLHLPTLRHLGRPSTLHPRFPLYKVPSYLAECGFRAQVLEPWVWYRLTRSVRAMSVPTFLDDSILILDTPHTIIFNLNDSSPPLRLLREMRERIVPNDKAVVVLKSYSPASAGVSTFREGRRVPHRDKRAYVRAAQDKAEALGARLYVPFASQAIFGRPDSSWANEYKVQFQDIKEHWSAGTVELSPPFVSLDLETLQFSSSYSVPTCNLDRLKNVKIDERQQQEAEFTVPPNFDDMLKKYHDEIHLLRVLFRRGIGWRLATSGAERFYNSRTRTVEHKIPDAHDFAITVPDKVLYEALCNNVLTDLGITMMIRVDTKCDIRLTYGAFMLMGMHDYGYFRTPVDFVRGVAYYSPTVLGRVPRRAPIEIALD
jgi:hypothetical protein